MKRVKTVVLVVLTLLIFACDNSPIVTVFVVDAVDILTKEEREAIISNELTHGRIIREIILNNSQPNKIIVKDIQKIETEVDSDTKQKKQISVIDENLYLKTLQEIIDYTDQHPEEIIIVNFSFGSYANILLEMNSEDLQVKKYVKKDLINLLVQNGQIEESDLNNKDTNIDELIEKLIVLTRMRSDNFISEEVKIHWQRKDQLFAQLKKKRVIMVAAAGNDNTDQRMYPAAYSGVIAVSASKNKSKASYSNYGEYIDITTNGEYTKKIGTITMEVAGTSFASPKVVAEIVNVIKKTTNPDHYNSPFFPIAKTAKPLTNDKYYRSRLLGAGDIDEAGILNYINPDYNDYKFFNYSDPDTKEFAIIFATFLLLCYVVVLISPHSFIATEYLSWLPGIPHYYQPTNGFETSNENNLNDSDIMSRNNKTDFPHTNKIPAEQEKNSDDLFIKELKHDKLWEIFYNHRQLEIVPINDVTLKIKVEDTDGEKYEIFAIALLRHCNEEIRIATQTCQKCIASNIDRQKIITNINLQLNEMGNKIDLEKKNYFDNYFGELDNKTEITWEDLLHISNQLKPLLDLKEISNQLCQQREDVIKIIISDHKNMIKALNNTENLIVFYLNHINNEEYRNRLTAYIEFFQYWKTILFPNVS